MKKSLSLILLISTLLTLLCFPLNTAAVEESPFKEEISSYPQNAIAINSSNATSAIKNTSGTYYLAEDITISSTLAATFSGILYGNGKTITVNGTSVFGELNSALIRDLIVEGSVTKSGANIGAIAATSVGSTDIINTICNVTVTNSSSGKIGTGGFIGHANDTNDSALSFENCINYGSVSGYSTSGTEYGSGGFVGGSSATSLLAFTNCDNYGTVKDIGSGGSTGGFAGGTNGVVIATYCVNYAKIAGAFFTGGIIGRGTASTGRYDVVKYCANYGTITSLDSATRAVGGIVGYIGKSESTISNCGSFGDVTHTVTSGNSMHAGGIVGYCNNNATIAKNAITGNVSIKAADSKCAAVAAQAPDRSDAAIANYKTNYVISSIENLYYNVPVDAGYSGKITSADVAYGNLAYLMQSDVPEADGAIWGQDIGGSERDALPSLFAAEVGYDSINNMYYNKGTLAFSNIVLTANFNLHAYVYLDAETAKEYTAVFTMFGKETTVEPEFYQASASLYRFTFTKIAPQSIAEEIEISLYKDDKLVDSAKTSVLRYCEGVYSSSTGSLKQLIADLVAYGAAARNYVIENGTSASSIAEINSPSILNAASVNDPGKVIPSLSLNSQVVDNSLPKITVATVRFDSTNRLNFTISFPRRTNASDWKLIIGNKEYAITEMVSEGVYTVLSDEIYAKNFMDDVTVRLTKNGNANHTLIYSVSIYAARKAASASSEAMRALAAATYWYGKATAEYATSTSSSYTLNGQLLSSFSVVANSTSNKSANDLVDFIYDTYNVKLPIITNMTHDGNAIFIDRGNTYGNVRYGIDSDVTDNGNVHIYIDGLSTYTKDIMDKFKTLIQGSGDAIVIKDDFYYNYPSSHRNNGYLLNSATDVVRTLADGVTYIERTYTTAPVKSGTQTDSPAGLKTTVYILILEADAKAHFEVYSASYYNTSCRKTFYCSHRRATIAECNNQHVSVQTAATLASQLEKTGKDVLAAFNSSYFMKAAGCNVPWGMQIVNGVVNREPRRVHNYNSDTGKFSDSYSTSRGEVWFGVTKDGSPIISDVDGYNSTYKGNIQNGIGGHTKYLITDGEYKAFNSEGDALVAIGYNANGDIVIVASDGDNINPQRHAGVTSSDLTQLFMDLDMDIVAAIQLDGGGSTSVLVEDVNGNLQRENTVNSNSGSNSYLENRKLPDIIAIVAN